jgi:hypothetical protein
LTNETNLRRALEHKTKDLEGDLDIERRKRKGLEQIKESLEHKVEDLLEQLEAKR